VNGGVDVSVLVPVRNEEAIIQAMVDSMLAQTCDRSAEFLMVDGRSTDATRSILEAAARADSRIRVIDSPGGTIPRALNAGLRAANGELIARMDAHALYPSNYLASGVARLSRGDVACVTGPAIPLGVDRWSRRIALALRTWLGTGGVPFRGPLAEEADVDRGFGGVWRRDTLLAHDGWDEDSPINEDSELSARIRIAGGRIVCIPEMAAHYVPRSSLHALARQYARYGYYRARTATLHPRSLGRGHVLPPGLVIASITSVLGRGRAAAGARAVLAGYAGTVLWASASVASDSPRSDTLALPLVFIVMHLTWGAGFLCGCARFMPAAMQR
jgi:cellulose synthase/poly-beta-1,6-N-acetylglucosamine synthase-like glycosyltransferase